MDENKEVRSVNIKHEIIYSVSVLIAIPIMVIGLTLFLTHVDKDALFKETENDAQTAAQTLGASVKSQLGDQEVLQNAVDNTVKDVDQIESATIAVVEDDVLIIGASTIRRLKPGSTASTFDEVKPANKFEPRSTIVTSPQTNKRSLKVSRPIYDDRLDLIGVSDIVFSLESYDEQADQMQQRAFFISIAVASLAFILLLRYVRFDHHSSIIKKHRETEQIKANLIRSINEDVDKPIKASKKKLDKIIEGQVGHVDNKARKALKEASVDAEIADKKLTEIIELSIIEQGVVDYKSDHVDIQKSIERACKAIDSAKVRYSDLHHKTVVEGDKEIIDKINSIAIEYVAEHSASNKVEIEHYLEDGVLTTVFKTGNSIHKEQEIDLFSKAHNPKLWALKRHAVAMNGHAFADIDSDILQIAYELKVVGK